MARRLRLAVLCTLALVAAGCGGGEKASDTNLPGNAEAGKQVFADAGCAGCHTMRAANATGTKGPNLDTVGPGYKRVVKQVTDGADRHAVVRVQARQRRDQERRRVRGGFDRWGARGPAAGRQVRAERHEARGLQRRLRLLRAGLRQPRLLRRARGRAEALRAGDRAARRRRGQLPPDRPRDRRGLARTLQGQGRACLRRGHGGLLVRVLPRCRRAGARGRGRRRAPGRVAADVRRPGSPRRPDVHALPVRARPRATG